MTIKKDNLYFILFSMGYLFLFITVFTDVIWDIKVFLTLVLITMFLPLALMIKLKGREILYITLLLVFGVVSAYFSRDFTIILLIPFIILSKNIDIGFLLKLTLLATGLLVLGYIIYFVFSYYSGDAGAIYDDSIQELRYNFGQAHPNSFSYRVFIFVSLYMLLKRKISVIDLLLLSSLNLFVFEFTHSRTSCYIIFLLIFSVFLYQYFNFLKYFIIKRMTEFSMILLFLSWYFISTYYSELYESLVGFNTLLSGRISFSYRALSDFGFNLLGKDITQVDYPVDVFYVYLMIAYGVVFSVIYAMLNYRLIRLFILSHLYREVVILVMFAIYFSFERYYLQLNYTVLFFSFLLYRSNFELYKNKI